MGMGGEECCLSPGSLGKHQGPKRKRLSGAPEAINQLLVTQRWQGQGPRAGLELSLQTQATHPHTHTYAHTMYMDTSQNIILLMTAL